LILAFIYLLGTSEMLPAAYHTHDEIFIKQSIKKLPYRFKSHVNFNYLNTFNRHGRKAANIELLDLKESLSNYDLAKDDDEIIQAAKRNADLCLNKNTLQKKIDVAIKRGIKPPNAKTEAGQWNRLICEHWWRRQLRKTHGQETEKTAINLGMVSKSREIYASNESVQRRQQQNRRNTHLLETLAATNEDGQTYTLKELSDLTTSNPELRRNELMTRIRGCEEIAKEKNHVGMFYTVTCPSRFHKKTTARNGGVYDNPKYDGASPRQSQKYLTTVWSRVRAYYNRHGIEVYGFRVAEPQHDGTPHWHLLLFMPEHQEEQATTIFRDYALADTPDEVGAQKHRFTPVKIDPEKGTAAGYIAKYIAKNIDGYALDCDLFGNDPIKAAARVQAWASTWGIRQFQQIGGASVTDWRNLRKMPEPENKNNYFYGAWRAASVDADWATYNKIIAKAPLQKLISWSDKENRYGEAIGRQLFAYEDENVIYPTQTHTWNIERIEKNEYRQVGSSGIGDSNYNDVFSLDRLRKTSINKSSGSNKKRSNGLPDSLRGSTSSSGLRSTNKNKINFKYADELTIDKVSAAHVDDFQRVCWLGFDYFRQAKRAPWTCVNNCTEKLKT